ncbi:MarR family winged helix-turn-helix transcriptional regulator [Pseudonocardia spinosispora]|uniref:MarR family winged helix-turn-helix transcriptional regulator n=1 Tax=Pseudonocardia spinosispora TaxID=103441 RepID=UPI000406B251|nr:MarR family transcriptional regulator [Pseudonocardia spinosispora]
MAGYGLRLALVLERLFLRSTTLGMHGSDDLDERSHQVLAGLARLGARSTSALGADLGIDRSRVSRLASRLVAAGLVARQDDETDGRAALLVLTSAGEILVEQRRQTLARRLDVLTAPWPEGLDAAFADAAGRLVADLTPSPATPPEQRPGADEPRLDPTERQVFRSVLAITDTLRGRVGAEVRPVTGLSVAEFLVLSRVDEFPGHSYSGLKALATKLDWSASRLSHQLARMESRGLVTREHDSDTGHVRVTVTPDARELLEKHTALHARAVRRHLLAHLTEDESAVFVRVAARLARST